MQLGDDAGAQREDQGRDRHPPAFNRGASQGELRRPCEAPRRCIENRRRRGAVIGKNDRRGASEGASRRFRGR